MINNGLTILPNQNLVENIGFDEDATHTLNKINYNINIHKNLNVNFSKLKHQNLFLEIRLQIIIQKIIDFQEDYIFISLLEKLLKYLLKLITFKK